MGYYKKSPSFGLPVQLRYVFPFFSINFKKLFTFFFNCDIFNRAWGYSSVGRALASHVRGQGFDSPYLHHPPKTRQVRVFFLLCDRWCICAGRRCRKGGVHPRRRVLRVGQAARDRASTHPCLAVP